MKHQKTIIIWVTLAAVMAIVYFAIGAQKNHSPRLQTGIQVIGLPANYSQIYTSQPFYPTSTMGIWSQGLVKIRAVIGKDGNIMSTEPISGEPQLVVAAMDAIKQWRYVIMRGESARAPVEIEVRVNFSII